MAYNPLKEKGKPIEQQYHNWDTLNVQPYDKNNVDPYTRARVILMNGIEVGATFFLHQMDRHIDDPEIKQYLAASLRAEQLQQKMINWLNPGDQSPLETTIGYEQVAVDLTAWLARTEPDDYVKRALDFALIEDFDHLYRYANLLDLRGGHPEKLVGNYTEIFPGRPTVAEHRHPFDTVSKPVNYRTANPLTRLHIDVIIMAEQQTMNFYMNIGAGETDPIGRGLYQEIAMVEEEHVSHYESLADPAISWWERLLLHEYMECYMYKSCFEHESDDRIKRIWEDGLADEITHLQMAAELFKRFDKREPAELIPEDMPALVKFQQNKDYVRDVIRREVDLTKNLTDFVPASQLQKGHRYLIYQQMVNSDGVPSQRVIEQHIKERHQDYRLESAGAHPVERFQKREVVVT